MRKRSSSCIVEGENIKPTLFIFLCSFAVKSVKMFMTYELMATFGISMILSFTLSIAVLLVVAAKRGCFRIGKAGHVYGTVGATIAPTKGQVGSPLLVTPTAPPLSMIVELESLKENPQ